MFSGAALQHRTRSTARRPSLGIAALLGALAIVGCRAASGRDRATAPATTGTFAVTDDAGHVVRLAGPAQRVISLIPSVTETLVALGATDRIVARTRYDVAPQVATLPSVGGGIDPSIEAIVGLHPDLVLAWDNDKRREVPTRLASLGIPVFTMRTEDTSDVFRGIANLGRLTGRDAAARGLAAAIRAQLDTVRRSVAGRPVPTVLYVVYNDPPMTAGPDSFIGQLIGVAGGRSVFGDSRQLWPTVSMEAIVHRDPDIIVLPIGEFKDATVARLHLLPGWRDLRAVREGHIVPVPVELVSRPGPDVGRAARLLRDAFHPELAGGGSVRQASRREAVAAAP